MSGQSDSGGPAGIAAPEQVRGDGTHAGCIAPIAHKRIYELFQKQLVHLHNLPEIARYITQAIVEAFDMAFCRIWLVQPGDICQGGCIHATSSNPALMCKDKMRCLHLIASSGIYTHIDGQEHRRVPLGAYKIGMIAAGQEDRFVINNLPGEPRILHQQWAQDLGLKSFAGYKLIDSDGATIGVLAMFAKHQIEKIEDDSLASIAANVSYVIQRQLAEDALRAANTELESRIEERTAELENANVMLVQEKSQREQAYEQTRAIIENSDVAIWSIDVGRRLLTYNSAFANLMNKLSGAIPRIGQSTDEFIHFDETERFLLLQDQCLGGAKVCAEVIHSINGQSRYYEISMSPMRNDGQVYGAVVFMADITATKQMLAEIRRREEEYRNIFDNVSLGIFRTALDGRPILVNKCAAKMLGFDSPQDACREIKNVATDIYENPEVRQAILRKISSENAVVTSQVLLKRKDGNKIHVKLGMRIIRDKAGNPEYVEGTLEDVTPQVQADETIRQNERKFKTFFEQSLVGLAMLSPEMTLLDANAKFREIFGLGERFGRGDKVNNSANAGVTTFSSLEIFNCDALDLPLETTLERPDGSTVDLALWTNRILNPDSSTNFIILLAEDISERKRLQRDLRKVTDAERHRLGQEIHDDLGQRLTGITFMAARLQRMMEDGKTIELDNIRKIVENLDQATRRARLIGHSMIAPEITPATLAKSIQNLADEYSSVLKIRCVFSGGKMSHQYSDATATGLYRICQEAISNAIKHGKATEVKIDLKELADGLDLIIVDNGEGFSKTQVDNGSGRGLYLMQTRAAMIGASLEISSVAGKGTTVHCRLPVKSTKGSSTCRT